MRGDEILQFFRKPEAEFEEWFQPDGNTTHAFMIAENELDLRNGFVGHGDCSQVGNASLVPAT